jgi:hypothetical protein
MTMQQEKGNRNSGDILEKFDVQQGIMEKIKDVGFAQYAEHLPNLVDAFDLSKHRAGQKLDRCICCMDERIPFGLHAAGSGMLLSEVDFAEYILKAVPDSISSHTGCGAAKLYAKAHGLPVEQADQIAKDWAQKKAKELGLPYIHLEIDKPFHYARVCYYDGTGSFNYEGVEGLPAGFVVGRKNMTKEASLAEVGVAINIIFGDHGFGPELLNLDNPFVLVAIGKNLEEAERLKTELVDIASSCGWPIKVDSFTAPQ